MNYISAYRKIGWNVTLTYMLTAWMSLCLSAIIPLSIGGIPWAERTGDSSKGKLLHMLGIEFKSLEGFMLFFAAMILLKTMLVIAERWLQQRIRFKALAFAQFAWLEHTTPSQQRHQEDATKKAKSNRNYIVKVIYRLPPDLLYFALLHIALALISTSFALITAAIFSVAMLSSVLLAKLNIQEDFSKSSSRTFRHWHKMAGPLRLTQQLGLARLAIDHATQEDEQHEIKRTRTKAILQGWLTILFFGNMMLIIALAIRTPNTYNTADVLSFILLLLYMQSTYKRIGRNLSMVQHARHEWPIKSNATDQPTHEHIQQLTSWMTSLPEKFNVFNHPKTQPELSIGERLEVQHALSRQGISVCWIQQPTTHVEITAWQWLCGGRSGEIDSCIAILKHFLDSDSAEIRASLNRNSKDVLDNVDRTTQLAWACAQAVCSKSNIIILTLTAKEQHEAPYSSLIEKLKHTPTQHDFKTVIYEYPN